MLLKSLLLQGFKSFADRTVIDFHPGVTGIVGPNGCGKSNIVDAVKWVLGETSAKALRGGEMADVIFNGTDKRQPHGMAEVTLTFSGCEEALGVDYNEVAITRRVYRDGKGEYALNGTQCRLRDINEMFMDTGIGQSAYSIMEQGKIDQLLSSKPEDRRAVFEEAAGITKFKTQKREALRKLEYTEANLVRVTDIIAELRRQMGSMQRQAAKARRYQEIHREVRVLDTHLSHRRYSEWCAEKSEIETSISSRNNEIARLTAELGAREEQVGTLRHELDRTDADLAVLRSQINEQNTSKHSAESRIGFNHERIRELETMIGRSQEEIEATEVRLAEQEGDLQRTDKTLVQIGTNIERQEEAIAAHTARALLHRGQREGIERQLRELQRLSHQAETSIISSVAQLTGSQSQIDADARRHERFLADIAKLVADREARAAEEQRVLGEQSAVRHHREEQESALRQAQDELRQTQADLEAALKSQREFHKSLAEKQSRLSVLEQLMARGEGLEQGTQKVLAGLNQPDLYLGGIRGLLSSYLEVEPEYVRAVEAALGFHLQTILVADVALAEGIVDTLTRDRLGEAVVLPESFLPSELPRQLSTLPEGSQAWAADKVRVRQPVGPIIDHLLGNVLIVPDLQTALKLRTAYPDISFATQNGEFVSNHGIIRGGRATDEPTSMLQRQNEIKLLKVHVTAGEHHLASLDATSATLGGLLAGFQEQLAEAAQTLHQTKLEESELQGQVTLLRREMSGHTSRIENLQWEADQVDLRRGGLVAGLAAIQQSITTAQHEAEAHRVRSLELDQALADAAREETESAELLNEMKRSLALEKQAAESLRFQRDPMMNRLRELQSLAERRGTEIVGYRERIVAASGESERLHLTIAGCQARLAELQGSIAAGEARRAEQGREVGEIERALTATRRQVTALGEQRGREEVKGAQISLRLENIINYVSERYQTSLEGFEADYHTLLASLTAARARRAVQEKRRGPSQGEESAESATRMVESTGDGSPASDSADSPSYHQSSAEHAGNGNGNGNGTDSHSEMRMPQLDDLDWEQVEVFALELRQRLDSMGPVNLDAIQEFEELEERHDFLDKEHGDLTDSKTELLNIIQRINIETKRMFAETFEQIRLNFQRTFKELFGPQAHANLILTSEDDPLESGIDIIAKPPGKKPTSITLLSGGERSMTAVALLFSIYMVKPSPFCVLDELDAPLDESNIDRFLKMLDKFIDKSQFVIVTHNKRTMHRADIMYGISMQEFGVSKPVGVKLTTEEKHDHERVPAAEMMV